MGVFQWNFIFVGLKWIEHKAHIEKQIDHLREEIKSEEPEWVYVVQYLAGANGWNCTLTNSMIFYSECGKYNKMHQASGRIDRRNTPFKELNYYHLISNASVDKRIRNAFKAGKDFNIRKFGECTR